jgi:hypothetical protein
MYALEHALATSHEPKIVNLYDGTASEHMVWDMILFVGRADYDTAARDMNIFWILFQEPEQVHFEADKDTDCISENCISKPRHNMTCRYLDFDSKIEHISRARNLFSFVGKEHRLEKQ